MSCKEEFFYACQEPCFMRHSTIGKAKTISEVFANHLRNGRQTFLMVNNNLVLNLRTDSKCNQQTQMKNFQIISFYLLSFALIGCSSSTPETKIPLKNYYTDCSIMEQVTWQYDFYEIIAVWGKPTDTLHFGKKPPKMTRNFGSDDYWHNIAFAWSDTSKVKVEGKLTIKLVFDAEIDSFGNYSAVKGKHASYANCYPLNESAY